MRRSREPSPICWGLSSRNVRRMGTTRPNSVTAARVTVGVSPRRARSCRAHALGPERKVFPVMLQVRKRKTLGILTTSPSLCPIIFKDHRSTTDIFCHHFFPPSSVSSFPSSHCTLQDGLSKARWSWDMVWFHCFRCVQSRQNLTTQNPSTWQIALRSFSNSSRLKIDGCCNKYAGLWSSNKQCLGDV